MPPSKKAKLKIKIFNKIYNDMQTSIKTVLRRNNDNSFSVKKNKDIVVFAIEMDSNKESYDKKNPELLTKISLLSKFFHDKPGLSSSNINIVWKYLEVMYSLAKEEKKVALDKDGSFNMENISNVVGSILNENGDNNGLQDLIKDISSKLENNIGDKKIDQTQIVTDLMSGNMTSGGINFQSIIEESSKSLHKKIQDGSLDVEKLKQLASQIQSGLKL